MVLYIYRITFFIILFTPVQMRAGTQTLIQALQALPWTSSNSSDNEDDSESDSEDERPHCKQHFNIYMKRHRHDFLSETFGFFHTHHSPSPCVIAARADS
jgi:hypothetical protein